MKPTIYERSYTFRDGLQLELGGRTLIMGILNATPDSFSDGGRYDEVRPRSKGEANGGRRRRHHRHRRRIDSAGA